MSGRDSVTEAQRKAVMDAFLRRQLIREAIAARKEAAAKAQRKAVMDAHLRRQLVREAIAARKEAAAKAQRKAVMDAHLRRQLVREAIAAREEAAAKAERERERSAVQRLIDEVPSEAVLVALSEIEPEAPGPAVGNEYLSLAEIEAQRRELAREGQPHGYDKLAKRFGKGARSTIRRRYKGLPPPGVLIPDVCRMAPPHQHYHG